MLCQRAFASLANTKYTLPVVAQFMQINPTWSSFAPALRCNQMQQLPVSSTATYCTGVIHANNEVGILKRVLKKVGLAHNSKSRLKVSSHILYETVADKINYLTFFDYFNMPNTFNSWFLVTELHVWMILLRAMAEGAESGEDGRYLRNCIVEAMWGDVNTRAKKLGANNPSRTRQQIETMSEQFQAALIAYDEGIMSDDRVLAGALWRRFLEMKSDDYTGLERLVKYVRMQVHMLDGLTREEFLVKPKIPWIDMEKISV